MNISARRNDSGFTLVELLIVISIIVVSTAAIVPSFTGYIRNQTVAQAMEQVKSDLRNTQNRALTGSYSDQLISGNPVLYWGIRFAPNNIYEYFISTNTTCPSGVIPAAQFQGNSSFSSDLQIKIGGNTCIFFDMAGGNITSGFSGSQIIVGYTGSTASGDCRRVIYNASGLIYSSPSILCT